MSLLRRTYRHGGDVYYHGKWHREPFQMKVWRLWTKILLGLSIVAVVASGITAGVLYGTHKPKGSTE